MPHLPARSILVAGPPCSGKTTYVELHKGEDDLVLDFDSIARDLGSIATRQMRAAACILIDPGINVCLARAKADGRPTGTADQILHWYATFKRWSGDRLLTAFVLPGAVAPVPAALGFFGVLDGPPALASTTPLLDPPPTP